ncbi:MAG: FtsX-like permease family protein, partial [Phycisphaerales bacterium]|nr:FtsX-like permease family protein [Phycisphaerales bacterium]
VGVGQASAEAGAVARQLEVEYPATNKGIGAEVLDASHFHTRAQIRQVLQALWGGVAFVLLIACANVANLLLGRAVIRSREMSIRAALGAGRLRVIRQLLTESVLLSVMAGATGVFLAYLGLKALTMALVAMELIRPGEIEFSMDRNVLLYLAAISIGTAVVFGLAPALRISKIDLSSALREGGQGTGVAADVVQHRHSEGLPWVYLPYRQNPDRYMVVAARTRVAPASLAPAFRQVVRDLDENLPIARLRSLADHVSLTNADMRLFSSLFTVLAIIALALASTGLYAVISQSVNQRTREMAIRAALGASEPRLWRLMFFQGMRQFTIGLVIGLALSFAVAGVLSSLLIGVSASDPITYLLVVSVLAIVATLACGLPARRASRSDPAAVLRFE